MKKQKAIRYFVSLPSFLFLLFVNTTSFGQASLESLVAEGNEAYNAGEYQNAISLYEQTLAMGQHSAALYFNLGNAYYKQNKVAESIFYFEKAKQLSPNDENILFNSAFAQNMTIDSIEDLPLSQIAQLQNRLFSMFSFFSWSVITIILLWIFVVLFIGYIFFKTEALKRTLFFSGLVTLLLFIGCFMITFTIDQQNKNTHYAILFSTETEIWSEPNQQGEFLFTLHEGAKIQLLDDLEDWQKIRIANGSEGWIKNAVFRKLD